MQVAVIADQNLSDQFGYKNGLQVAHYNAVEAIITPPHIIFYLLDETTLPDVLPELRGFKCHVVVNAVCTTLQTLPVHFSRLNAWPGFLLRPIKEVSAREEDQAFLDEIFGLLGWQYQFVADTPGLIAARIIAMIINEAWYAYTDGVSTQQDIDLAMKLGTNYPYGPFEWGKKIGLDKIVTLLLTMAKENRRYAPAPLLLKQVD